MSAPTLVSYLVLWLLVLLLTAAVVLMARQIGLIHARMPPVGATTTSNGPDLGEAFPPRPEVDLKGNGVLLGGPRELPQLVAFMRPRCPACVEVAPAIRTLSRRKRDLETVVVIDAPMEMAMRFADRNKLISMPVVASEKISADLMMFSTPYAIYIDAEGVVRAKGGINTLQQLEGIVDAGRMHWLQDESGEHGEPLDLIAGDGMMVRTPSTEDDGDADFGSRDTQDGGRK